MRETNGVHHATDEAIDSLYAWMPPQAPALPCPEALFSCTVHGKLDGQDCMMTVRGMSASAFTANLQAVRGLLDAPQAPPGSQLVGSRPVATQGQEGFCAVHGLQMKITTKNGQSWYSHKTPDGWCKGK
jgi:hypothetical protein